MIRNFLSNLTSVSRAKSSLNEREKISLTERPDFVVAIGDVHGRHDLLLKLEEKIITSLEGKSSGENMIVMLGDYIDRGASSRTVINHLMSPPPSGFQRVCLCGNHEQEFLHFFQNPTQHMAWLSWGGAETLESYGISSEQLTKKFLRSQMMRHVLDSHVPKEHIDFLEKLPSLLAMPNFVFVHAGIQPNVPLEQQTDLDLLWIRTPFLTAQTLGIADQVVHGHTPVDQPVVSKTRIGIDTGAHSSNILTAAIISRDNTVSFVNSN